MTTLTFKEIETAINNSVDDIINNYHPNTLREIILEAIFEEVDNFFGNFIKDDLITNYTVDDLIETAADCAIIIKYAEKFAWIENDTGLWKGLTYGVLASIAFFSLQNCIYKALEKKGCDTNDDFPLENKKENTNND